MSWKKKNTGPKIERKVHEIDASKEPMGRLATRVATLLMGKHKPGYIPHIDAGDTVKIINIDKVVLTGRKWEQKVHYRTSNRPGGLKITPVSKLRVEKPAEIIKHAVKYMLPKNRTQAQRMKRLIFV